MKSTLEQRRANLDARAAELDKREADLTAKEDHCKEQHAALHKKEQQLLDLQLRLEKEQ